MKHISEVDVGNMSLLFSMYVIKDNQTMTLSCSAQWKFSCIMNWARFISDVNLLPQTSGTISWLVIDL